MELGNGQSATKKNLIEKAWGAIKTFLSPKKEPKVPEVQAAMKDPFEEKGYTKAGEGYYMQNENKNYTFVNKDKIPADVLSGLGQTPAPAQIPLAFNSGAPAVVNNPTSVVKPVVNSTIARNPDVAKYPIPSDVDKAINQAATEFGIPASLLYDIAYQESKFNPSAKASDNGFDGKTKDSKGNLLPYSSATGLFQFTDGTWDTVSNYGKMKGTSLKNWGNHDRNDPYANARAAAYLIKFGQLSKWDASKDVWGPHYQPEELESFYSQTPR